MNNFERRFGKFSIANLTNYIIFARIFVMLLGLLDILGFLGLTNINQILSLYLVYDVPSIMSGQVWRLFTWIFIPQSDPFWFIFEILFLFWIGTNLERIWGSFKYTMYILGSVAGVAVATLIIHFANIHFDVGHAFILMFTLSRVLIFSLLFPFAWYKPNEQVMFMFLFSIKIKYLALINLFFIAWALRDMAFIPVVWLVMSLSLVNMLVFFSYVITKRIMQKKRSMQFKNKANKAQRDVVKRAMHRCTVCNITENDDPGMSFRYCSKCEGDYEYCEKHLRDHKHKTKIVPFQ